MPTARLVVATPDCSDDAFVFKAVAEPGGEFPEGFAFARQNVRARQLDQGVQPDPSEVTRALRALWTSARQHGYCPDF